MGRSVCVLSELGVLTVLIRQSQRETGALGMRPKVLREQQMHGLLYMSLKCQRELCCNMRGVSFDLIDCPRHVTGGRVESLR